MATSKKAVLTAQLPPTPCTPQMREMIVKLSSQRNRTIADIQREAFSLFLSNLDRQSTMFETLSIDKEQTA